MQRNASLILQAEICYNIIIRVCDLNVTLRWTVFVDKIADIELANTIEVGR